jgi:hypothetical protein
MKGCLGKRKEVERQQALQPGKPAEPVDTQGTLLSLEVVGPSRRDVGPPESDQPTQNPPPLSPLSSTLSLDEHPETRLRVSSRHLTLASPYFKRMLKGPWREGNELASDGRVSIPMEVCDSPSLVILMNIIHGHTRKVPRSVDLDMLAKISVLVDLYECAEAVELFADTWIDQLKNDLPTTYVRDLILWTCISWVFRKSAEFKKLTAIAQMQSQEPIQTLGLPIPGRIVG